MISENLASFFGDFGTVATVAGVDALVLFDEPGTTAFDASIVDTDPQIVFAAGAWSSFKAGDAVTVGGAAYIAREIIAQDDGALMYAKLRRAA